jgi:hypothetical protein
VGKEVAGWGGRGVGGRGGEGAYSWRLGFLVLKIPRPAVIYTNHSQS